VTERLQVHVQKLDKCGHDAQLLVGTLPSLAPLVQKVAESMRAAAGGVGAPVPLEPQLRIHDGLDGIVDAQPICRAAHISPDAGRRRGRRGRHHRSRWRGHPKVLAR
jgi:hypothetical protein